MYAGAKKALVLLLSTVVLTALVVIPLACSDDGPSGLATGETCTSHDACRSGLCTVPPAPDGGFPDGGLPAKRCQAPDLP